MKKYILCINSPDKPGIVASVSGELRDHGINIEEAAQFNDHLSGNFFARMVISPYENKADINLFAENFIKTAKHFNMKWELHDMADKVKTLIMVSKADHCLNNILYRWKTGQLPIEITCIVSNHTNNQKLADDHGIPFIHLPVNSDNKAESEKKLAEIISQTESELIVLARYMQILSDDFCKHHNGRVINIHHSFLPGFKGAKPYHQAYERGVKMIGATAHFATADLDEGPIIEQETLRIDHSQTPDKLQVIGKDIEAMVLSKAIQSFSERRIFLHGQRTIIL